MMRTIALLLLPPMVASTQDASLAVSTQIQAGDCTQLRYVANPVQDGANVTIASMYGGDYASADWSFMQAHHIAYAKRHGLNYFAHICDKPFNWDGLGQNDINFAKFATIKFVFDSGADAVFWMDADSAFVDVDKDVRCFLAEAPSKDLIVSGDFNAHINAGHFMIRNSPWSINLLRMANSLYPMGPWANQSALMAHLGGADPSDRRTWEPSQKRLVGRAISAEEADQANRQLDEDISQHVLILPQDAMNSYEDSGAGHVFIRHFPGLSIKDKLSGLKSIVASVDNHPSKSSFLASAQTSISDGQKQTLEPSAGSRKSPMNNMFRGNTKGRPPYAQLAGVN